MTWAQLEHTPTNISKELQPFSDTLSDITNEFADLASMFVIRSFAEQEATRLPHSKGERLVHITCISMYTFADLSKIVERGSARMGHPSELVIPLYTTHQKMCQFTTPEDSSYETVRSQIHYLAKLSLEKVQRQVESDPDELAMRLAGLPLPNVSTRYEEVNYSAT